MDEVKTSSELLVEWWIDTEISECIDRAVREMRTPLKPKPVFHGYQIEERMDISYWLRVIRHECNTATAGAIA